MNKQYESVKTHMEDLYPNADTISYTTSGTNMITADVEGKDLHKWVTFHLRGTTIVDMHEHVYRKQCKDICMHEKSRRIREGSDEAGRGYRQRSRAAIAFYTESVAAQNR